MARTKNRFNAVQIPQPVADSVPVKQRKSFALHFMPDCRWN